MFAVTITNGSKGSIAAGVQSGIGNVAAGSWFAFGQSAAAGGPALATTFSAIVSRYGDILFIYLAEGRSSFGEENVLPSTPLNPCFAVLNNLEYDSS